MGNIWWIVNLFLILHCRFYPKRYVSHSSTNQWPKVLIEWLAKIVRKDTVN